MYPRWGATLLRSRPRLRLAPPQIRSATRVLLSREGIEFVSEALSLGPVLHSDPVDVVATIDYECLLEFLPVLPVITGGEPTNQRCREPE